MNSRYFMIAFLVSLNTIAPLGNSLSAQEPTITGNESIITPESSSSECLPSANLVSQRIQLFYYRQATNIVNTHRSLIFKLSYLINDVKTFLYKAFGRLRRDWAIIIRDRLKTF